MRQNSVMIGKMAVPFVTVLMAMPMLSSLPAAAQDASQGMLLLHSDTQKRGGGWRLA